MEFPEDLEDLKQTEKTQLSDRSECLIMRPGSLECKPQGLGEVDLRQQKSQIAAAITADSSNKNNSGMSKGGKCGPSYGTCKGSDFGNCCS